MTSSPGAVAWQLARSLWSASAAIWAADGGQDNVTDDIVRDELVVTDVVPASASCARRVDVPGPGPHTAGRPAAPRRPSHLTPPARRANRRGRSGADRSD